MTTAQDSIFDAALCFWESASTEGFGRHWFATGNALPAEHFLVTAQARLAQWHHGEADFFRLETFLQQIDAPAGQEQLTKVIIERYWFGKAPAPGKPDREKHPAVWGPPRVAAQLQALLCGVLSAWAFRRWEASKGQPEEALRQSVVFAEYVARCVQAYQRALSDDSPVWNGEVFPISDEQTSHETTDLSRPGEHNDPHGLLAACMRQRHGDDLPTSCVLMWRRLVNYLLGPVRAPLREAENANGTFPKPIAFQAVGQALWARENSDEAGEVSPVYAQLRAEGPYACYWDPVALGVMALDDDLLGSVRQAWHVLNNEIDWKRPVAGEVPAAGTIRILLERTEGLDQITYLEGASAGALVACTIYAAAHQQTLNRDTSITAVVVNDRGRLHQVGGLISKFKGAQRARISTVVVAADHPDLEKLKQQAREYGIILHAEESLAAAIVHLLGDHRCEETLRAFAAWQQQQWAAAVNSPDDDRLDHYLIPRYSAYWPKGAVPPSLKEAARGGSLGPAAKTSDKSRRPRYRQLKEDVAPEQSRQRPDGTALPWLLTRYPWLVLAEDAGAGKSVFTRRAVCWFSSPAAWEVLSQGKPLLALRWANERDEAWRVLFAATGDSVQALDEAVASRLLTWYRQTHSTAQTVAEDAKFCRRIAEYARLHGRLCLILDAMDQTDADVLDQFVSFASKATPPTNPAAPSAATTLSVRLLLTSRLYKLSSPRYAKTFSDGRWGFARIEPFDATRRRLYLADLPEELRRALVPDDTLFAEAEDDDHDAATFGSPETLKMLREDIEDVLLQVQQELQATRPRHKNRRQR